MLFYMVASSWVSSKDAEIMRSSLRVINHRQNTEVQNEDESFSDDHAFLQSLLPKVNECIKSSDYRGALNPDPSLEKNSLTKPPLAKAQKLSCKTLDL